MSDRDSEILADRVAAITADAERTTPAVNWQLYGVIAVLVLFFGGMAIYVMGGESTASAPARIVPQKAYTSDEAGSRKTLFGDAQFTLDEDTEDEEVAALRAQLSRLERELDANKPTGEMPEEYKKELERMRAEMAKMQENFAAQIGEYQGYIEQLEATVRETAKVPERPVSLRDDKWIRAQTISTESDKGEAARIAAPTLVFDASRKRNEDEDDQQQIIEELGRAFPTSEELELAPQ